jgi:hypothetical protein
LRPTVLLFAAGSVLCACSAAHRTRTVGAGRAAGELSLGGPISTALDVPVPMPVVFLGGRYGLRDDLDLSLGYNLSAPIVPSIPLHMETAVHWAPIQPGLGEQAEDQGWSLVTNGRVVWLSDFDSGLMVFPALGITGAYRYRWVAPYLGFTAAYHAYRPFERGDGLWLTPHLGLELTAGEHLGIILEAGWMDAASNLYGSGLEWVYLRENEELRKESAVFAPMIGFTWDFDTRPGVAGEGGAP